MRGPILGEGYKQPRPGYDGIHFQQKFLAPGLLGLLHKVGRSKAQLFHAAVTDNKVWLDSKTRGTCSGLPYHAYESYLPQPLIGSKSKAIQIRFCVDSNGTVLCQKYPGNIMKSPTTGS